MAGVYSDWNAVVTVYVGMHTGETLALEPEREISCLARETDKAQINKILMNPLGHFCVHRAATVCLWLCRVMAAQK